MQVLALKEQPLVELRALAERELVEEIAAHQLKRLRQPGGTLGAIVRVGVRMAAARLGQSAKARNIQLMVAERVETQAEPIADQVRLGVGTAGSERFLQLRPGDAQIVLRSSGGQVGPQQAKQNVAAVRAIRLDQEIGQQPDRLAVGERDRAQLSMRNLQATQ